MKKEELVSFIDKKVRLNLKSGYNYSGTIIELNENSFCLLDKFGLLVRISYSELSTIRLLEVQRR